MDRQPVLDGERLLLEPLAESDWDDLFAIASDRELWALHPVHDRWQEPVFRAFFDDAMVQRGALIGRLRDTGEVVSSSRFQGYAPDNGGQVEIGWTLLARKHWGSGLNREMKALMVGHALSFVDRVVFRVGEANWRSRRAVEKIGGRLTDEIERVTLDDGREVAHVVYEIRRADFESGPLSA